MTWQSLEREELHERRDGSAFRDPGLHPRYCLPRNALGRLSPSCPPDPPVYPLPESRTRACVWVRSMTSTMVEIRETPFRVVIWVEHPRAGTGAAQGTGTEMMSRSADEMSPFRRAPQAEAGRRPGAYTPLTLRPPVSGQHRRFYGARSFSDRAEARLEVSRRAYSSLDGRGEFPQTDREHEAKKRVSASDGRGLLPALSSRNKAPVGPSCLQTRFAGQETSPDRQRESEAHALGPSQGGIKGIIRPCESPMRDRHPQKKTLRRGGGLALSGCPG